MVFIVIPSSMFSRHRYETQPSPILHMLPDGLKSSKYIGKRCHDLVMSQEPWNGSTAVIWKEMGGKPSKVFYAIHISNWHQRRGKAGHESRQGELHMARARYVYGWSNFMTSDILVLELLRFYALIVVEIFTLQWWTITESLVKPRNIRLALIILSKIGVPLNLHLAMCLALYSFHLDMAWM